MKKTFFVFLLIFTMFLPSNIFAEEIKYEVPVRLVKFGEPEKESMGNPSLKQMAEVIEKDGKFYYKLYLKKMEFMNMEGELTNLFIYESDKDSNRSETTITPIDGEYNKTHEFVRNNPKEKMILVAVWVDAMDAIAGGGKGSGEQKAYLEFDWTSAKVVSEKKDEEEQKMETKEIKNEPVKSPSRNSITIIVNGNEIMPETPPYLENGRTMVPLRFVSEALGEEVKWEGNTRSVIIGDKKAELKLGSKEIIANGKKITIDSPAVSKNSRTFVPLRAISEILGAKVEWKGETKTIEINK